METPLFLLAKLVGFLLRVESWIVLLAVITVLAQIRGRTRLAFGASSGLMVGLIVLAVVPVGALLLRPLEAVYPMHPRLDMVDGIIVLGGSEDVAASVYWGGAQLRGSGERLASAAELARRYPTARLLLLGAGGRLRDLGGVAVSEAQIAARFLTAQGVEAGRIVRESQSRNTAENARHGLALASPGVGETWVLVTSAYHMPRAVQSFEAAGWNRLVPYPVDFRTGGFSEGIGWNLSENLDMANIALREWVGRFAYGVMRS